MLSVKLLQNLVLVQQTIMGYPSCHKEPEIEIPWPCEKTSDNPAQRKREIAAL